MSASGVGQEGERKRSTDDVSKTSKDDIETGGVTRPAIDLADACRLARRCRHGGGASLVRASVWNV